MSENLFKSRSKLYLLILLTLLVFLANNNLHNNSSVSLFFASIVYANDYDSTQLDINNKPKKSSASGFGYAFGNDNFGNGGFNIPQSFVRSSSFLYAKNNKHYIISIVPGIAYHFVSHFKHGFVSIGPGITMTPYGLGPGASIAFGFDFFCYNSFCLQVIFRQALAVSLYSFNFAQIKDKKNTYELLTPASLRLGVFFSY